MAKVIVLICQNCGNPFEVEPFWAQRAKYCSRQCVVEGRSAEAAKPEHIEGRFWKTVDKTPGQGPEGDCWIWVGHCREDGYGRFPLAGKLVAAHRFVWELTKGQIPKGEGWHGTVIRHKCNNRPCVNPDHLETGTQADNNGDTKARGRARGKSDQRGSKNDSAKFTEDQIRVVRKDNRSHSQIAREYGVDRRTIGYIKSHKTWTHVTDD